ncbi:MAG: Dihydrofolate reductase [Verrucomicrobiales bacterium]|nr:Dihydrofolate reductase [Verrucomicrobiales bacterium]
MSQNRVIGSEGKIPWHIPEDFKWFKKITTGNTILMGRKTFESIGRPLPNRVTIVLSRGGFNYPGVRTVKALSEIDLSRELGEVFVCGGAEVYRLTLPRCSDLYLTLVKREVVGDTFFPEFESLFDQVDLIADTPEYRIDHYRRRLRFANRQGVLPAVRGNEAAIRTLPYYFDRKPFGFVTVGSWCGRISGITFTFVVSFKGVAAPIS